MEVTPELIWFLIGLGLILAEFILPGIILVFFGLGAWIVALTTWMGLTDGWPAQLLVFAFSSVLLLVVLRRRIRARFFGHVGDDLDPAERLDDFVGRSVTVIEPVTAGQLGGKVEFNGALWSARSTADIPAGRQAVIESIDGLTLQIREYKPDGPASAGSGLGSDHEGED